VRVSGESEPMIRRNIFVQGEFAVDYGSFGRPEGNIPPTHTHYVRENLFWKIDRPVARCDWVGKESRLQIDLVELPAAAKNRVVDPQITIDADGHAKFAIDSPARQADFAVISAVSLKSRWPLTDVERAMLPDNGSRDVSKWKTGPAAKR
jgi:hypothetical protein